MPKRKTKRKKPSRRKRIVEVNSPKPIPYSKYRIEWIDILSDSGWADEDKFDKMKLAEPVNEGWVYERTKDYVKLFASYDKDEDGYVFGDRTMIPVGCIRKMTKII
tara:strand:+ start:271 stop:588 length:318 start_codon:yes stop_codon:yes gene_type:complete